MEFNIKLELVCVQMCNDLRFKLIRVPTPKLCLINLITWVTVVQLMELRRPLSIRHPLWTLYQDTSVLGLHCFVAGQEDTIMSAAEGSRRKKAFLHCISREALFFSNLLYSLSYVFQLISAANEDKVHVSACPKLALRFVGGNFSLRLVLAVPTRL